MCWKRGGRAVAEGWSGLTGEAVGPKNCTPVRAELGCTCVCVCVCGREFQGKGTTAPEAGAENVRCVRELSTDPQC